MRDMAKKAAYDRMYNERRIAQVRATGAEICVQCWRRPREVGHVCLKCRRMRRKWTRVRYLGVRPNAGTLHCSTCGEERHNSRTCPAKRSPLGRCACGLMLPCYSCLPTVYEMAASRRGSSSEG